MKIEPIMSKLDDYFKEATFDLIIAIEDEDYELASEIRDDLKTKVYQIYDVLIKHDFVKIPPDILFETLVDRKNQYIKDWYTELNIPGERQINNI